MDQTLSLYRLQRIDTQLDRTLSSLAEITKKLEDDATLRELNNNTVKAEADSQAAEADLRQAEESVRLERIKIEQAESSLYSGSVHNPKELQDLQNDIASLKRHLAVLEDRLLAAMLKQEEAETALKRARDASQAAQALWSQQHQNLCLEQESLEKEKQKLSTERSALTGTITASNSNLYDQLRTQRRGIAVATISDNTCDACGCHLTPAQAQSVRSATEMARCPSCGRILYAP